MSAELRDIVDQAGLLTADALVEELRITKRELAYALGLGHAAIIRKDRLRWVT